MEFPVAFSAPSAERSVMDMVPGDSVFIEDIRALSCNTDRLRDSQIPPFRSHKAERRTDSLDALRPRQPSDAEAILRWILPGLLELGEA